MLPAAGTCCAIHPDTPASVVCDRCVRPVCNTCVVFDAAGAARCSSCSFVAVRRDGVIPWERRAELGLVTAFVETVKEVVTRPQQAFLPSETPRGLWSPLLFAMICCAIGGAGALFWQVAITLLTMSGPDAMVDLVILCAGVVLACPLQAVVWMFAWGGLQHLMLAITGVARSDFEATARVVGYSSVAVMLSAVPVGGSLLVLGGSIVLQVIGISSAHQISPGRAAAVVLVPVALCCVGMATFAGASVYALTTLSPELLRALPAD